MELQKLLKCVLFHLLVAGEVALSDGHLGLEDERVETLHDLQEVSVGEAEQRLPPLLLIIFHIEDHALS